jgi:hypothetical protein
MHTVFLKLSLPLSSGRRQYKAIPCHCGLKQLRRGFDMCEEPSKLGGRERERERESSNELISNVVSYKTV